MTADRYPRLDPAGTALKGRCPRCGEGRLYNGPLKLRERCTACGLSYDFVDAGDGPVAFVVMIAGFIVLGLALWLELSVQPPFWVHMLLWIPLILIVTIGLTRFIKSLLIFQQYRHKAAEGVLDRELE